jgi:hypothetical protein
MTANATSRLNRWGLTALLALVGVVPAAAAIAVFSMRLSEATGVALLGLATFSGVMAARRGTRWWLVVSAVAALWELVVVLQMAVGE